MSNSSPVLVNSDLLVGANDTEIASTSAAPATNKKRSSAAHGDGQTRMNKVLYVKENGDLGVKTVQSYGSKSERHQNNIDLLLDWLVGCNIPLSIVDTKAFYNWVTFLDPKFNVVSSRTLRRRLEERAAAQRNQSNPNLT